MRSGGDLPYHIEGLKTNDGLQALIQFARLASNADFAIAFEATETGLATPLAAAPEALSEPFALEDTRLEQMDWSKGRLPARDLRLPVHVLLALGGSEKNALFIPTPIAEAPRSGILLLWAAHSEAPCTCSFRSEVEQSVPMLTQVFTQMLSERRHAMQRQLMSERFHDLFESVSSGIVVLDGDGGAGLINEPGATLLGIAAGEVEAATLAKAMRNLRQSCVNTSELQTAYSAIVGEVNYAITKLWDLGDRQFKVDTHPMRGDGQNGRIWLFNEVTAQHRLEQELRGLATTDPLTGLANRRQFAEIGGTMLRQTRSDALQLSVLLLDIDHFKSINDRYGHHTGDVVLQTFAQRCQTNLREQDLIARLGGEEFAVVLPGAGVSEATVVAERLLAAIAASPISTEGEDITVSVSIGFTTRRHDDRALDELLGRADQALYTAKQTGRNKVVFSVEEG